MKATATDSDVLGREDDMENATMGKVLVPARSRTLTTCSVSGRADSPNRRSVGSRCRTP